MEIGTCETFLIDLIIRLKISNILLLFLVFAHNSVGVLGTKCICVISTWTARFEEEHILRILLNYMSIIGLISQIKLRKIDIK